MAALNVLVVEDETALRVIYERVLERTGSQVLLARDGHQALAILEAHTPDLIFLDMLLPGISGLEVLETIAATPRLLEHTQVVIASSSKEYEQNVHLVPGCRFILKPIMPTQIRDIALALIEAKQLI